jgi:hypothetical protein
MIALLDAEHLELVLVPANHEIKPKRAFADVIGGDEFLGCDQRVEQRRVHGVADRDAAGQRQQPAHAHVTVSKAAP